MVPLQEKSESFFDYDGSFARIRESSAEISYLGTGFRRSFLCHHLYPNLWNVKDNVTQIIRKVDWNGYLQKVVWNPKNNERVEKKQTQNSMINLIGSYINEWVKSIFTRLRDASISRVGAKKHGLHTFSHKSLICITNYAEFIQLFFSFV